MDETYRQITEEWARIRSNRSSVNPQLESVEQDIRESGTASYLEISEQEWLTSDNPNLLYSYINDGTEEWQFRNNVNKSTNSYFVDACERICTCGSRFIREKLNAEQWSRQGDDTGDPCPCTKKIRVHLIREIYGNPFRPVVREELYLYDPATCSRIFQAAKCIAKREIESIESTRNLGPPTKAILLRDGFKEVLPSLIFKHVWISDDSLSLIKKIDNEGDYDALPILADLLEEAGCSNRQVLDHCRTKEMHAKGCWVVEMLKGYIKEEEQRKKYKRKLIKWDTNE